MLWMIRYYNNLYDYQLSKAKQNILLISIDFLSIFHIYKRKLMIKLAIISIKRRKNVSYDLTTYKICI